MLDNSTLFYDGYSQGGIMGMALAAISTDFQRAVLGVVGMNYSMLLPRSVDFEEFEQIFVPAYPDSVDRAMVLGVIQMLGDRAEGGGYVRHVLDDPLPGTPPKKVLMHVAFGDWQVSELTGMVAARTMGAPIRRPVTAEGRSPRGRSGLGHRHARSGQGFARAGDLGFRLRPHPTRGDTPEHRSRSARRSPQRRRGAPSEGRVPVRRRTDRHHHPELTRSDEFQRRRGPAELIANGQTAARRRSSGATAV